MRCASGDDFYCRFIGKMAKSSRSGVHVACIHSVNLLNSTIEGLLSLVLVFGANYLKTVINY